MAVTARHVLASTHRYLSQTPNPTATALPTTLTLYAIADERSSLPSPPASVGWTVSRGGRGTIDIISKCFVVLAFCCWSSLHLNVPSPTDSSPTKLVRKIRWAVVAVVIPEAILALAIMQRLDAIHTLKSLKASTHCKDWNLSHAFFVNMGGFCVVPPAGEAHEARVLDAKQFISLLKNGKTPPATSEADLDSLSKSNSLGKAISLFGGAWLLCTTIVRCAEHSPATDNPRLPISPLEVTSSIFVLCILAAYVCWWHKPYDVQRRIEWKAEDISPDPVRVLNHIPEVEQNRVLNTSMDQILETKFIAAFGLATFVFGGLHLLVLPARCHFPTAAEKWMWVGSSAILALSGPCYVLLRIIHEIFGVIFVLILCVDCLTKNSERRKTSRRATKTQSKDTTKIKGRYLAFFATFMFFYLLVGGFFFILRLLLLVLALASLRKLDVRVYDTPRWIDYTPFG